MTPCPACQTENIPNTVFCRECGSLLLDKGIIETEVMEAIEQLGVAVETTDEPEVASSIPSASRALRLHLTIYPEGQSLERPLDRIIYLGRAAPEENHLPEIDLSASGDQAPTISRRHARIFKNEQTVLVEDLSSTNGTFVNGTQLAPFSPQPLMPGDLLQVGGLAMKVAFITE